MTKDEALSLEQTLRLALEALKSNRSTHHYCEDTWYSCPKHEDGCANEHEGDECNCGADEANAGIDQAITAVEAALEAKDEPWEKFCDSHCVWTDHHPDCKLAKDEPVGYFSINDYGNWEENESNNGIPLYTNPPQRKPLTEEQIDVIDEANWEEDHKVWGIHNFARAIEAAHGIKGEA